MNDYTSIAKRILACGVGHKSQEGIIIYWMHSNIEQLTIEQFCTHPAVVLALMKKAIPTRNMQIEQWDDSEDFAVDFGGKLCADGPLEPAIVLACLDALEEK